MALKGTLQDFSVADIFQLIGQQTKSGSLFVRTKEKEIQIVFDKGKVVLGTFRKSDEDFLLGTMLLRAGAITAEQLSRAMQQQQTSLRSLGDVLRSMGAISPTTLGEFVGLQLKEVLFRLFQWKEGLYEFVPGDIKYNRAIIQPSSAEGVLMEGFRMLDEWPGILAKVGSLEDVFRGTTALTRLTGAPEPQAPQDPFDSAFSAFDEAPAPSRAPGDVQASQEEIRVLGLLDGRRTLQEVVYLSRLGTFETARTVAGLLDRGLAEKTDRQGQTFVAPLERFKTELALGQWFVQALRPLLAAFFLFLLLPFVAFGLRSHWSARYMDPDQRAPLERPLNFSDLKREAERGRIRNLLEIYRLQAQGFPPGLKDLEDPWLSRGWNYERTSDGYFLTYEPARK